MKTGVLTYTINIAIRIQAHRDAFIEVKWLFNIRISVDGGDLDDSVCCFIIFWIQFWGRSRKETMFYTVAEIS